MKWSKFINWNKIAYITIPERKNIVIIWELLNWFLPSMVFFFALGLYGLAASHLLCICVATAHGIRQLSNYWPQLLINYWLLNSLIVKMRSQQRGCRCHTPSMDENMTRPDQLHAKENGIKMRSTVLKL